MIEQVADGDTLTTFLLTSCSPANDLLVSREEPAYTKTAGVLSPAAPVTKGKS
jgi:hypothetical protein